YKRLYRLQISRCSQVVV
ncbi:hypothetical protein Zm00014a_042618, partial [Zea mays]